MCMVTVVRSALVDGEGKREGISFGERVEVL
jgi:hypothetical protein